jgi:outer membrane receptor for ferrienterochelin and colicin
VTVEARRALRASAAQRVAERRYLGLGRFVDREEIVRRGQPPLAELLRSVPGVRVTGSGPHAMVTMARVAHSCYPVVFLDGTRLNRAFDEPGEIASILAMIPGRTIETVEVYRGPAETPGDFGGADAPCGVIGVWSIEPTRAAGAPP